MRILRFGLMASTLRAVGQQWSLSEWYVSLGARNGRTAGNLEAGNKFPYFYSICVSAAFLRRRGALHYQGGGIVG